MMPCDLAPSAPSDSGKEFGFDLVVRQALAECLIRSPAQRWCLEEERASSSPWLTISTDRATTPEQGWKIHVSATIESAEPVLSQALPILLADDATFKVARSVADLQSLNEGHSGLSQIGKFITVYPSSDAQAVRLAAALDQALQGFPHPDIPSDRPLRQGSAVYYRYGSFGAQHVQLPTGQFFSAVAAPDGSLIPDRRVVPYSAPDWTTDPFLSAGVATNLPERSPLLHGRYLVVCTMDESARGSIHLAADIISGRRCLVKRAARHGQVGEHGLDARVRLRREADMLTRFANTLATPAVYDLIPDNDDLYLVMEDLEGETLSEYVERLASHGRLLSTDETVALGREMTTLLGTIHNSGVIYRDLKSTNVIRATDGGLRLIDFELACESSASGTPDGRGTEGYMSPQASQGALPTAVDDIYSLGALLYFLATAAEPSLGPTSGHLIQRPVTLLNPRINSRLAAVIGRCLEPEASSRFPSMAAVDAALQNSVTPDDCHREDLEEKECGDAEASARCRSALLARRLGDSLSVVASRDPSGGIFWASNYDGESGLERRDLSGGSAGVVLSLAELVAEFNDPGHREALSEGALWLAKSKPWGTPLPELYVGESGVAAALLRAGQVLNCNELVEIAAQRGCAIAALPTRRRISTMEVRGAFD